MKKKELKGYLQELSMSSFTEPEAVYGIYQDSFLLVKSIQRGLPYFVFDHFQSEAPFSEDEWAEYLNISRKTLQRHRQEPLFRFKPIHSEKIFEIIEVSQRGKEVFASLEQFKDWLHRPSLALGNLSPAKLLQSSYGKDLVLDELNRIEHGIFV